MWIGLISIFPEMFGALEFGIPGRAQRSGMLCLDFFNPRDFSSDKHHSVDDKPYGGGPGMVMMAEPILDAIQSAKKNATGTTPVIYLSPQGRLFDQAAAAELSAYSSLIMLCGRYEGIDERIIETAVDMEFSIGNYVISGGEIAAMTMIDAITRLIPGAVGDIDSINSDSITSGLLKYPQYTRPESCAGSKVPDVLLSGNHELIKNWRTKTSLGNTWLKRPDILAKKSLNEYEAKLLIEFINEFLQK